MLALKLRLFLSPENLIRNFYSVTDIFRMEQSSLSMRTALQFSCVFANFVCIQSSVRRNVSRCSVLRIYCKVSIIDLICVMIFFENMISALYGEATLGDVKKYFFNICHVAVTKKTNFQISFQTEPVTICGRVGIGCS